MRRLLPCLMLVACGGPSVSVTVLDVAPVQGFSLPGSPNAGMAVATVTPPYSGLQLQCSGCTRVGELERRGHTLGTLAILVDASGSNEVATAALCKGCPTDKTRQRVVAVKALVKQLLERAPSWRIGVFDFGPEASAGFEVSRQLAGYGSNKDDLIAGADRFTSGGGTYLYDALCETLPTVTRDAQRHFVGAYGTHVLVVSDGEDTLSFKKLDEAIALARDLGIAIDSVGFGPSDDGGFPVITGKAMKDLRRAAFETGGVSALRSTDRLVEYLGHLTDAYVGGVTQVVVQMANPPDAGTVVFGQMALPGGVSSPFSFLDSL